MSKEEQLLTGAILESIREANIAVSTISNEMEGIRTFEQAEQENDRLSEAQETLAWYIRKLYRDVGILAERMSLPILATRIAKEFEEIDPTAISDVDPTPYDIGLISPHLGNIRGYFDSIAVMTNGNAVTGLDTFRTILENTPSIMKLADVVPQNEAEVRAAVYEVLKITFHDAVREIPVSQLLKTFKPDLGVRSLMAAAEYKFVQNEAELKSALEGLYADMKGYNGHYEWRTFFAVIYTTDAIIHRERLAEEFRGVRAELNWTPILVTGSGARKPRAPKKATKPQPSATSIV
ncbi:hypothetical protein [Mesorhizobium sp. B1-1-7]|uniref:PD-(D/E)XK nuclease domain-containing protein n=1 Tax=Mesorhizobium sp. B1-1-7 TaxID=2589977 RepID=UPI00112D3EC3|nr:hypothetical protein [Mesorhizobium sp. B1-1-7]TPN42813.1 hypothetical protein FJ978_32205 [Mesorhizobium sp. B1-1-7]